MSSETENNERLLELGTESQCGAHENRPLSTEQSALLNEYIALIKKWDRVHSLVSKGDRDLLKQRHVADSLAIEPFLKPASDHLDIGSGAGFPGVPLAICRRDVRFVLNDRSSNKCRFLREVKFRLSLDNVDVQEHDIGPRSLPSERYDTISIRAVAPPEQAWSLARPLLRETGMVLLHTHTRFSNEYEGFSEGVVLTSTPSVRGSITAVARFRPS